ncbi:MAG: O-antigen ligase family protein [Candidatus Muiribacteriota bacterium]
MKKNFNFYINKTVISFIFLIVFITPLMFSKHTKQNFLEAKEFFLIFSVSLLLFLNILYLISRKSDTDFFKTPLARLIFAFIISMFISMINSPNLSMSVDRFLRVIIYYIVVWTAYENIKDFRNLSNLFFVGILTGGIVSLYGIFQYFGIDPFFPPGFVQGNVGRLRIFSTFGNPNFLADYLVLPFPIAFMYFVQYSKSWKGKLSGISFILMSIVILFTRTRGAWLGAVFAFLYITGVIFIYKKEIFFKILKYFAYIFASLIIIAILLFTVKNTREPMLEMSETVLERFTSSSTALQRILMWRVSLEAWKDKPIIGQGLHSFKVFYSDYQNKYFEDFSAETGKPPWEHWLADSAVDFRHAHNDFVQTLSEQGLLGFVIFCMFFIVSFYNGTRLLKKDKTFYFNLGLNASLVCVGVEAVFNFPFHRAAPYLTAMLVMMAIQWQFRKEDKINKNLIEKNKILAIFFIILTLGVTVKGFYKGYLKAAASVYHKAGHMNITQRNNPEKAQKLLQKSIEFDNSDGEAFYWYGYSLYLQEKFEEADKVFEKSLNFSHNKLIHLHLAIINMRKQNFEKAKKHLNFLKYSDPLNPYAYYYHYTINSLRENENKYDYLKTAVLLNEYKADSINEALFSEGIKGENEYLTNRLWEETPFDIYDEVKLTMIFNLHFDKLQLERKTELIEVLLEKNVRLNLRFKIIKTALEYELFQLASEELDEIIKDNPNLSEPYFLYAELMEEKGNEKKAREYREIYERIK